MKAVGLFSSLFAFARLLFLNHPIQKGGSEVIHLVPNHR
jgi:hypothetical protein